MKERDYIKKQLQKNYDITCLTRNTNVKTEDDAQKTEKKGGKEKKSEAVESEARPSLFNQVLKRRKSRQSNFAPAVVDFDYAGDSAKFQHLVEKRPEVGYPNKSMLNFEVNLRSYKNITDFNAGKPWLFPAVR